MCDASFRDSLAHCSTECRRVVECALSETSDAGKSVAKITFQFVGQCGKGGIVEGLEHCAVAAVEEEAIFFVGHDKPFGVPGKANCCDGHLTNTCNSFTRAVSGNEVLMLGNGPEMPRFERNDTFHSIDARAR